MNECYAICIIAVAFFILDIYENIQLLVFVSTCWCNLRNLKYKTYINFVDMNTNITL